MRRRSLGFERDLFVNVETWLDEQELGTFSFCGDGSHGGMDPEAARLIARRSHDPALSRATTATGLPRRSGLSRCSTDA